jgi:hypothetical protein
MPYKVAGARTTTEVSIMSKLAAADLEQLDHLRQTLRGIRNEEYARTVEWLRRELATFNAELRSIFTSW